MDTAAPHRLGNFSFLSGSSAAPSVDLELFRRLRARASLSLEDQHIADRIERDWVDTGQPGFLLGPQESRFLANNGSSTFCDYLIYRYKVRVLPKLGEYPEFPAYVLIEPTSVCNLRCVVCFQVDPQFTRKPFAGVMSWPLYQSTIDQCIAGGTRAITLASRGEPTLHPELGNMLRYASQRFFDLKLNTNATRLDEAMCHQILQSDLSELVFSIDAHSKGLYERIRVRGRFEQVLANVARFQQIRRQYPRSRVTTRVAGVRFLAEQDAEAFAAFWSQYCDQVGYVDAEQRWNTYENSVREQFTEPCSYLFERMYVWWDGTVNPCDVDYQSRLSPGKLGVDGLTVGGAWNSAAYQTLRAHHAQRRRGEHMPCDRCGVA